MPGRSEHHDELIRNANYFGEQAARAYLDGAYDYALEAADLSIKNLRTLVRIGGDDLPKVIDVLADALRDRAEIISMHTPEKKLYLQAIRDGEEGVKLYRQHGGANGRPAPLWIASVQILLAELHAMIGQSEPAMRTATAALADYRKHTTSDEQSQFGLAQALSRYARVMVAIGAADAVLAARRESVLLYRPAFAVTSDVWRYRFDSSMTWLSTPTLERASLTARDLASRFAPPDNAAEALAALQDAAEGFASLGAASAQQIVLWIAGWLTAIDARETADAYREAALNMPNVFMNAADGDWIRSLRPLLTPYLTRE